MGLATVSAMVAGFAPGNCAVTMTDGGTTSGYSEIGRFGMEIKPPRRTSADKTPAKTGRSMKKREMFMRSLGGSEGDDYSASVAM